MYFNFEFKSKTNYAAPEAPAIFIVLGLICISAFIKGFNQTWGYFKLSNKQKKLLLAPFLLFDIFYGFLGLILLFIGLSSFTYNYSYILPTILGCIFGLILFLTIQKYLIDHKESNKITVLIAFFTTSLFMILIARQMHFLLNADEIFLRSFVASSISTMIFYYSRISATLKAKKQIQKNASQH